MYIQYDRPFPGTTWEQFRLGCITFFNNPYTKAARDGTIEPITFNHRPIVIHRQPNALNEAIQQYQQDEAQRTSEEPTTKEPFTPFNGEPKRVQMDDEPAVITMTHAGQSGASSSQDQPTMTAMADQTNATVNDEKNGPRDLPDQGDKPRKCGDQGGQDGNDDNDGNIKQQSSKGSEATATPKEHEECTFKLQDLNQCHILYK